MFFRKKEWVTVKGDSNVYEELDRAEATKEAKQYKAQIIKNRIASRDERRILQAAKQGMEQEKKENFERKKEAVRSTLSKIKSGMASIKKTVEKNKAKKRVTIFSGSSNSDRRGPFDTQVNSPFVSEMKSPFSQYNPTNKKK